MSINVSSIPLGININSMWRYPISPNRPESALLKSNPDAAMGRVDDAVAKQLTSSYNYYGNTDVRTDLVLYEPLSIKLGTYGCEDGTYTIHDVYNRAMDYAGKNNINTDGVSYKLSDNGVIVTEAGVGEFMYINGLKILNVSGGKSHLVTWEELGFSSPLTQNSDDRYFIDHHIFGEIEFENSIYGNVDFNEIFEVSDKYRLMTEHWYSVNDAPPDTFSISNHPNNINIDLFKEKYYNTINLAKGYGMNVKQTVTSTDTVINSFIDDFNRITAIRQSVLKELELYYSIDEITKRAQNAGFGDDTALFEKIIEAQYNYGQGVINVQKINQGYFNADKGLEQSLADYLTDKWRFNTVFEIFGFANTYEDRKALAESVAKAVLTGSDIQIGDFTMSYEQFLSIEKTMASVYSSLSAKFTSNSSVSLDSLQRTVEIEGLKYADKRIGNALNNWFNDMVSVYNHIWDLKAANMGNAYWNIMPWNGQK